MAYENFTLDDVKHKLGLSVREAVGLFADVPPVAPSAWLEDTRGLAGFCDWIMTA